MKKYDAIIVGAGHAGVEAASILAKLKLNVLLVTISKDLIATLPCNPSMGGPAKGILIKEVDALGGVIGKASDACAIQKRLLNNSKGPAVWAIRMQIDKKAYSKYILNYLESFKNIDILEDTVNELIIKDNKVTGVITDTNNKYDSTFVILTTGTYMASAILIGEEKTYMGPDGLPTNSLLSKNLKNLGLEVIRLKTGTPPRLYSNTIDFSKTTPQEDLDQNLYFAEENQGKITKDFEHLSCYITKTTLKTRDYILDNIKRSPMYSGMIKSVGPRYCPSIEDKMMRFSEKETHQVFLEPETREFITIYPQGLSSSLARPIQRKFVQTVTGLENAKIKKYGYAIEYDAISPLELKPNLETKKIENLFCAGQINGTSGYEEAAGQGIMAGINAYLKLKGEPPFILKRYEAYIGVLIDDLVTKGTIEPYRMLTSRAEHRLILRNDNAITRLRGYANKYNILNKKEKDRYLNYISLKDELINILEKTYLIPSEVNDTLRGLNIQPLKNKLTIKTFIKRPEVDINVLGHLTDITKYPETLLIEVTTEIKYDGYIKKEFEEINKIKQLENLYLGNKFDYKKVLNLSFEAREKLEKVKPETLGQASRILGVNPSDISILMIYLRSIGGKR